MDVLPQRPLEWAEENVQPGPNTFDQQTVKSAVGHRVVVRAACSWSCVVPLHYNYRGLHPNAVPLKLSRFDTSMYISTVL